MVCVSLSPRKCIYLIFVRPPRTVDAAWCVEFTEHVGRNFQQNYFASFRKAAFIFMTHSHRGGWHHVEVIEMLHLHSLKSLFTLSITYSQVHDSDWWILRMESMGFVYSSYLTKKMRGIANKDWKRSDFLRAMQNNKKKATFGVGQHLIKTLQVSYVNKLRYLLRLTAIECIVTFIHAGFYQSTGGITS